MTLDDAVDIIISDFVSNTTYDASHTDTSVTTNMIIDDLTKDEIYMGIHHAVDYTTAESTSHAIQKAICYVILQGIK